MSSYQVPGMVLTDAQKQRMMAELSRESSVNLVRRQTGWVLKTDAELERDSPSRKEGLSAAKEAKWLREYVAVLQRAGMQLKVPQWAIGVAVTLCHRFYTRRSMKSNDRFIVATACLHLALKMEESPKSIKDVVRQCRLAQLGSPDRILKQEEVDRLKDEVLVAERSVLYTLGFNLQLAHPYTFLLKAFAELGLLETPTKEGPFRCLMQNAWNFANDSLRTTLCLQHHAAHIAFAAIYMANMLAKTQFGESGDLEVLVKQKMGPDSDLFSLLHLPKHPAEESGRDSAGAGLQHIKMGDIIKIVRQILHLYETVSSPHRPSGGPTTPGARTPQAEHGAGRQGEPSPSSQRQPVQPDQPGGNAYLLAQRAGPASGQAPPPMTLAPMGFGTMGLRPPGPS